VNDDLAAHLKFFADLASPVSAAIRSGVAGATVLR